MDQRELETVADVIEALGGLSAVATQYTESGNVSTVSTWKKRGLPSRTYTVMTEDLRKRGHTAPARLWGMRDSVEAA